MKISILLPYKENFSHKKSGAVSIFVNDLVKNTVFKSINIFGNTDEKDYLDKRYNNLRFNKRLLQSSSKKYIEEFLKAEEKIKSDVIEVHNRPYYVNLLKKFTGSKIILYFHNDPLTMAGSTSLIERNFLLSNVDHFIFNSKWSRDRFKLGIKDIEKYNYKLSIIYQTVNKPKINFRKKEKIISFIGKLNTAKGFDVFGKTILKILDKYPDWKSIIIGEEPREKLNYIHKNIINYGQKNHKFILKKLETTSISVICSRWNEPLGRASLEACSRGSVPIITNKGGLPETSKSAIILKDLNVNTLFKSIETLILNRSLLTKLQKKNYKEFIFTPGLISRQIDNIRQKLFSTKKINFIKNYNKFKILHITNFNERYNGRLHYNTGRRINNGLIRNEHIVFTISDRDIIHNSKKINDLSGKRTLNLKILSVCKTFNPDLILLGHADSVKDETLFELKNKYKNLKFGQWFLDPVTKHGPDYINNKTRLMTKSVFMDANFLTTSPDVIDFNLKNSYFIPNPADSSFEILDNYKTNPENDLFFAMSHGVHRGILKKGKTDNREIFLKKLVKYSNKEIKFDFYGVNNIQPIWAEDFLNVISNSKMGLNLSRGLPVKYYSSDRIAQNFGNGLLTFIDKRTQLNDLFNNNEAIFYNNIHDLAEKILKYKKDNKKRKEIAKNGKQKYMKYYNSTIISQYMIDKIFDLKSKKNYIWI